MTTNRLKADPENDPVVIQFFHSGRERVFRAAEGATTVRVSWAGEKKAGKRDGDCGICSGHARRLVVHDGQYVDKTGVLKTGKLAFWTEWEAATTATRMPPSSAPGCARWRHAVESPLVNTFTDGINTDPCVFGSTFKYCCCQQHVNGEAGTRILRRLPPGSIVLFGSRIRYKTRFLLDTVFVVSGEGVDYIEENGASIAKLGVSDEYRALALDRLHGKRTNTFFRGATFDSHAKSIWSFTPTRVFLNGNSRCGERFFLDVEKLNGAFEADRPLSTDPLKKQGITICRTDCKNAVKAWKEILRQVRGAGFLPAVHFDWPSR